MPPASVHTFVVGIPHAAWLPERRESVGRLREILSPGAVKYFEVTDRGKPRLWMPKLWSTAAEIPASHALFVEDDCELMPQDFWTTLRSMVQSLPSEIICLYNPEPCRRLAEDGYRGWARTLDGCVAQGYVFPKPVLRELVAWTARLAPGALDLPFDRLLGVFAVVTRRFIYHPVPTILACTNRQPSTFGNPSPPKPEATWKEFGAWHLPNPSHGPVHLGRFFETTHMLASQWAGLPRDRYLQVMRDECPKEYGFRAI
jgi:hypothetical protein